jgi:hypothetical protein
MVKWCRISLLLLCLIAIVLSLFLNHVGLPEWLTRRVEAQFRAKGWDLKYSRLRLRWYRGIVAEDLQLQRVGVKESPQLFLPSAEFRLNLKAFRHFDLEANSVWLRGGRLLWPVSGTNHPPRTLVLNQLGGELFFLPNDLWELRYLEADVLGTHVRFRGELTNASFIREWKLPKRQPGAPSGPGSFWHRFFMDAEKVHFAGRPELQIMFSGDAQNWKSFEAQMRFAGEAVKSPWASGTNLSLTAHVLPSPRTNDALRVDVRLSADAAQTQWGAATNLDLTLVIEPSLTQWIPTNTLALLELRGASNRWCRADRLTLELRSSPTPTNSLLHLTHLDLAVDRFQSKDVEAMEARVTGTTVHAATNMLPASLDTFWTVQRARSTWATSQWAQVRAALELPSPEEWRASAAQTEWPERLRAFRFQTRGSFSNVLAPRLAMKRSELALRWRAPLLGWEAGADLADAGAAQALGTLQTDARELRFATDSRLQPSALEPWLETNARPWLAFCKFATPPRLQAEGRVVLPSWTNRAPDWLGEVLPTLQVTGRVESAAGVCQGVSFAGLRAPFTLTNLNWTVPGLSLARPEGSFDLAGTADQRSGRFRLAWRSGLDPLAFRAAFVAGRVPPVFDAFTFAEPPRLQGRMEGNWANETSWLATASLQLTNATFRGQAIKGCTTRLVYTNRFLSILEPSVVRDGGEAARADGIGIDLRQQRLYLTNAVGRMAVRAVTKCIGPITDRSVAPYVFDQPPFARVEGTVPLGRSDGSENMTFEVAGGPFHWERFHLEQIKAVLRWRGNTLDLTNVAGFWHGADMAGWAHFDFTPRNTDLFNFFVAVDRVDLRKVLKDLRPSRTNRVEGLVSGDLRVTSADTHNWESWQGYGQVQLTNGLLWDIPVFGVFSPVLNAFVPGLGNSRARNATASYNITNSVIHSDDLIIRGGALRMNYQGSIDFALRMDGRMEAEVLRDVPAIGLLFSKLLWPVTKLFDYRIAGTLDHPKTEELYIISRVLMMPLHPLKMLKELMNLEEKFNEKGTRPPPKAPPKSSE